MKAGNRSLLSRRHFAGGLGTAMLCAPSLLRAETLAPVRRNASSFRTHNWQDHFDTLGKGIIIADTISRALQQWTADGTMFVYPTSVPMTDELTRPGIYGNHLQGPGTRLDADTLHARARPNFAGLHAAGSGQSAWSAVAASDMAVLPHSRDT